MGKLEQKLIKALEIKDLKAPPPPPVYKRGEIHLEANILMHTNKIKWADMTGHYSSIGVEGVHSSILQIFKLFHCTIMFYMSDLGQTHHIIMPYLTTKYYHILSVKYATIYFNYFQ